MHTFLHMHNDIHMQIRIFTDLSSNFFFNLYTLTRFLHLRICILSTSQINVYTHVQCCESVHKYTYAQRHVYIYDVEGTFMYRMTVLEISIYHSRIMIYDGR